jgi:hypothetical protein
MVSSSPKGTLLLLPSNNAMTGMFFRAMDVLQPAKSNRGGTVLVDSTIENQQVYAANAATVLSKVPKCATTAISSLAMVARAPASPSKLDSHAHSLARRYVRNVVTVCAKAVRYAMI